jgi:hypothetical protein
MPEDEDNGLPEPRYISPDDRLEGDDCCVRITRNLPATLQFRVAYAARELLRIGVQVRALGILLQLPGGADYHYLCHDDDKENTPPEADDPYVWLHDANRGTVLGVLTECFHRFDAADAIKWIPEVKHIEPEKLSTKWQRYLNRQAKYECGLLNVVAECLDQLVVRPGIMAIVRGRRTTWWQDYWSKTKK